MASSRNSPGIHDRKNFDEARARCIAKNRVGKQCRKYRSVGSKLCLFHKNRADNIPYGNQGTAGGPSGRNGKGESDESHMAKGGVTTTIRKKGESATAFVLNNQARAALSKLRTDRTADPSDPSGQIVNNALAAVEADPNVDPKRVLLDTVNAAWRQRQIWEAMLTSVPEEDWEMIGTPPVPGSPKTARGARIEAIQKYLGEATKSAARISKLAIDAGIEERLVRLAEEQSAMIADTVRAALVAAMTVLVRELRMTSAQESQAFDLALHAAADRLRIIAAGGQDIVDGVAHAVEPRPTKQVNEAPTNV